MKFIWLSANLFGYSLLQEALKLNINIDSIITLSENSKTKMYDRIEHHKWSKFGIPIHRVDNINNSVELLQNIKPDIIVMCGWRQILNENILNIPRYGVVNFHLALLPMGRGPAPIINALLHDFEKSGVTMFYTSKGLDVGDIIGQEECIIDKKDHAEDLYKKIIGAGKKLIRKYLPLLEKNKAPRKKQDDSKAIYFEKRTLKDNEIDLETDINVIYNKIRAFSKPYKGAFIRKGNKKLIIWKAELVEED